MNFDIVPTHSSHLNALTRLFENCFGNTKLSLQYIDWLYFQNPDGNVVGTDIFHDGTLIAHYGLVPRNYIVKGWRTLLSVNTATHQDYRGKGLFPKLATNSYRLASSLGYDNVVGVANANSINGFTKKLNFQFLGNVRLHITKPYKQTPKIDITQEQLKWRLSNPNARYILHRSGDHKNLYVEQRGVFFNIGAVKESYMLNEYSSKKPLFSLTPHFSDWKYPSLKIPLKFQPSPWNVIVRNLNGRVMDDFTLSGLHMDTF